ncbi:MAG TPA: arylamine N-acetyltransferase [Rhodocyclaceae bacterium]|nr:arylamine N-acetyltransferase [Rhodocyclaceae bacterium]
MTDRLDLPAYLERIAYRGELRPSLSVLSALHLAHATHIPFENLDILLGRAIRLDLESLQAKLLAGGRGGYCFEQNLLFAAGLEALGFAVQPLAARVRYRSQRILPRTHMLLLVDVDGGRWLCDVGFGAEGLLLPVPFGTAEAVRHFAWRYRIVPEDGLWLLQSLHQGQRQDPSWQDLYAFSLETQHLADFEMASHYVSTHPDSRFVQTLTAQLPTPEGRHILRNRELVFDRGASAESRLLADDEELLMVLAGTFGLRFPPGTRFCYRDGAS